MRGIHQRTITTVDDYDMPGDYFHGANIAGFVTVAVADAMIAPGTIRITTTPPRDPLVPYMPPNIGADSGTPSTYPTPLPR
jgi:hypothetical protein